LVESIRTSSEHLSSKSCSILWFNFNLRKNSLWWKTKVHHNCNKSPSLAPTDNQFTLVYFIRTCLSDICINIIFPLPTEDFHAIIYQALQPKSAAYLLWLHH
jgi:hypothetical protein